MVKYSACVAITLGLFSTPIMVEAAEHSPAATEEAAISQQRAVANLWDMLRQDPRYSRFTALIKLAKLQDLLASEGPWTVYAPSDEAFDTLPSTLAQRLAAGDQRTAEYLVKYHIVSARLGQTGILHAPNPQALIQQLSLRLTSAGYQVNEAKVTAADQPATNGLLNRIDQVLLPHFID